MYYKIIFIFLNISISLCVIKELFFSTQFTSFNYDRGERIAESQIAYTYHDICIYTHIYDKEPRRHHELSLKTIMPVAQI